MTDFHPVQVESIMRKPRVPTEITLRAYEVYRALFGDQPAIVEGGCRGGFGIGELLAMLYARSFPKDEWRKRFDEACRTP